MNITFTYQAIISYYVHNNPNTAPIVVAHIRLALAVLCTIFFIVVAVTGIISHILFNGTDPRKWYFEHQNKVTITSNDF